MKVQIENRDKKWIVSSLQFKTPHINHKKDFPVSEHDKSQPLVKANFLFNWDSNFRNSKSALEFDSESWINKKNMKDIQDLGKKINLVELKSAEKRCQEFAETYEAFVNGIKEDVNIEKFKKWLGSHHKLPHCDATMDPIFIPDELLSHIEFKIADELNEYVNSYQTSLKATSYSWKKEEDIWRLQIKYTDQKGDCYYEIPLLALSEELLKGVIHGSSEEIGYSRIVYLLYRSHWNLGLPTGQGVQLKSQDLTLFHDTIASGEGFYEQLRFLDPQIIRTELGVKLKASATQANQLWKFEKAFKKYERNYYLTLGLLKLVKGSLDEAHHSTTVRDYMEKWGFPSPDSLTLHDDLCRQVEYKADAEKLCEEMGKFPESQLVQDVKALADDLKILLV
ncbi:MAG: hypothetical protein LW832_07095 [Parachlamydia sp.]|nr:hypothetical protein [Parachlamydia sp.]